VVVFNAKWEFSQVSAAVEKSSITISPEKLDFAAQEVGASSEAQVITLANSGTSPLRITDILVSGIDFSKTNNCNGAIAQGAECTVQVRFKPAIAGPRLGALRISSSAHGGVRTVPLSGVGQ
jgi:hypothetical protein